MEDKKIIGSFKVLLIIKKKLQQIKHKKKEMKV